MECIAVQGKFLSLMRVDLMRCMIRMSYNVLHIHPMFTGAPERGAGGSMLKYMKPNVELAPLIAKNTPLCFVKVLRNIT